MGSIGPQELLLVLVLALMVLGPDKLPEAARWLGRFYGDVKKMRAMVHQEVRGVMRDVMDPINDVANEVRTQAGISTPASSSSVSARQPQAAMPADRAFPLSAGAPGAAALGFDPSLN